MLSNSGHDERYQYNSGRAGDNTGTEWELRSFYRYPWNCVLRYEKDERVGKTISNLAIKAAKNDHIGYDQYQRQTYWNLLQKANYDPSKITTDCEADCSAGVIANTKAAGYLLKIDALKNITSTYTGNMRSGYKSAGFTVLTDSKYLTSEKYLKPGDILLNDSNHVCTYVGDGTILTITTPTQQKYVNATVTGHTYLRTSIKNGVDGLKGKAKKELNKGDKVKIYKKKSSQIHTIKDKKYQMSYGEFDGVLGYIRLDKLKF